MYRSIAVTIAVAGLALGGCGERTLTGERSERECWDLWECNGDRLCGEMIQCLEGLCRSDLPAALIGCPGDECVRDSDCVIAEPTNCCHGCPEVMSPAEVAQTPCFYAQGLVPPVEPPECRLDCMACSICFPQPRGTRCRLGFCVDTGLGCLPETPTTPVQLTTQELVANPQAYDNTTVLVRGSISPGRGMCTDDCPSPGCCDYAQLLDGVVQLGGSPCDLFLHFWSSDTCTDELYTEGFGVGDWYELEGRVVAPSRPGDLTQLEVLGVEVIDPGGIGGAYDVAILEITYDTTDPLCTPPEYLEGDRGLIVLAEVAGSLKALAEMFECWGEFLGTSSPTGAFAAQVPMDCDECCCDYYLRGTVTGDLISGEYESWDGRCGYVATFDGHRKE